jgi:pimeloyl-ACP methyl ester carboxylesterase
MRFNQLNFDRLIIKRNGIEYHLYRFFITFCFTFLVGCSTTSNIKYQKDFVYKEIPTDNFTIATWQKTNSSSNSKYIIFIEGDGNAFNSYGYPTLNPTPKNSKLRKLAFKSNSNNVIYMARPCQFVKDKKCNQSYWTTARFSKEVIDSMAQTIKSIVKDNKIILVGYSGGGQIAGLIAVGNYNINIIKLITIAGNLDHKSWTKHHNITELSGSLDLNNYREQYLKFPQIHYVGEKDKVVPSFLTEEFVKNNKLIVRIPKAGHGDILDKVNLEF